MGDGPNPVAPTKTAIAPNVLDAYFKSIEEPFRETCAGMAKKDGPNASFVLGFVFCLIPLFPYLVYRLLEWRLGTKQMSFRFVHVNVWSFWFLWLAFFVVSLAALIVATRVSGPSKEEKAHWLSPQQMRFAYCYATVDEIRHYKTNQLSRHIEKASEYLRSTSKSLKPSRVVSIDEGGEIGYLLGPQVQVHHAHRPAWYRLRPETELILKGYSEFLPKLRDRLKDRKDLVDVEAALTDLAGYRYTEIPEISSNKSEVNFEQVGEESLLSFARRVTSLSPYRSEPEKQTPKDKLSRKILSFGHRTSSLFSHQNVLVAFLAWWILMFVLFCGGFYIAFRLVPALKMDTTVVTAMIGGPITTAVAAVTIPRLSHSKKTSN